MSPNRSRQLIAASLVLVALLVVSGIHPYDRATWFLEVFPVLIALPVLWITYRSFPLTTLLYVCIFFHGVVLLIGGTYTYARVPIGFVLADYLDLSRNPYDKIGHFFQGFVPALVTREILIRGEYVRGKKMLTFVILCIVLAISASYELIEWVVAIVLGQGADEFLGTQGYAWDTQSDMFLALIGATIALLFLANPHDRQINRLQSNDRPT
jgi:putative membrane protein